MISKTKYKVDGTPKIISQNKCKGRKSEVCSLKIEDQKKIVRYLSENGMWIHYLMFVLSYNMARRVGDMLSLKWENFFYPETGEYRSNILEIQEEKTNKIANPRINSACRSAIKLYIEKTGCDVSAHHYTVPVFLQLSGTYKGRVLSDSGYYKKLKSVSNELGIKYNIGTHSSRKTFGRMSIMMHPGDSDSLYLLQRVFNHSDPKTTLRYSGLEEERINAYYDDMGSFFEEYIVGDKEYEDISSKPVVSINANDLRELINFAYEMGMENANETDAMTHVNAITSLMQMIEELQK